MDYRAQLVTLVETYAAAAKRSEARIANLIGRDGRFFQRMRDGRGCSVDTRDGTMQWFSDHWPAELPWPEGIDRPTPVAPERAA
jgi:hypothetical protein